MTPRNHDLRSIQPCAEFVALRWLVAGLVACTSLSAHALYANATPPAGFGGSPAGWTFAPPPSSAEKWLARTAMTTTTLNVGGRTTTMNALLRLSMLAPRAAAASLFTPAGMAALAGSAALTALMSQLAGDGIQWDSAAKRWNKHETTETTCWLEGGNGACIYNPEQFCAERAIPTTFRLDPGGSYGRCFTSNNIQWGDALQRSTSTTQDTVTPITYPDFETELLPYITPEMVPDLVPPGTPLPVELPIINPGPGDFPEPQVRRIPLGDFTPYPSPNSTTSTQYRAPILDIKGSPTQAEPWRVDVQPKDIVKEVPNDQPAPDPVGDPVDLPTEDPNPAPTENKDPGLCERYPDILACQKPDLDTPEDEVPKTERQISFTPESLFGGGTCPANPGWSDALGNHELNLVPVCDILASVVRPLVLAMAALAALFIVSPFRTDT